MTAFGLNVFIGGREYEIEVGPFEQDDVIHYLIFLGGELIGGIRYDDDDSGWVRVPEAETVDETAPEPSTQDDPTLGIIKGLTQDVINDIGKKIESRLSDSR